MEERNTTYRNTPSILATLQSLPEVIEMNSDSSWQLFNELQSAGDALFQKTQPCDGPALRAEVIDREDPLTVNDVMVEARRHNRISPIEPHWQRLWLLLDASGKGDPPRPMTPAEAAEAPALVRRIRVRDQVEWAGMHGLLPLVLRFFRELPEDHWSHMGR